MNTKKTIPSWIGNLFSYGVLCFMGYLTFRGVYAATNDKLIAALAIALFDGGAYAGYTLYVGHAAGEAQRTTALTVLVVDFLLACAMVAGGLFLIPSTTVLWVMLASAAFNGAMAYYYKTHDPDVLQDAREREIEDAEFDNHIRELKEHTRRQRELYRIAQEQARITLEREGQILGAALAKRATARIKNRMRLVLTESERKALAEDVIEGHVEDVKALPAPDAVPSWVRNVFAFFDGRRSPARYGLTATTPNSEPSSNSSGPDSSTDTPESTDPS